MEERRGEGILNGEAPGDMFARIDKSVAHCCVCGKSLGIPVTNGTWAECFDCINMPATKWQRLARWWKTRAELLDAVGRKLFRGSLEAVMTLRARAFTWKTVAKKYRRTAGVLAERLEGAEARLRSRLLEQREETGGCPPGTTGRCSFENDQSRDQVQRCRAHWTQWVDEEIARCFRANA